MKHIPTLLIALTITLSAIAQKHTRPKTAKDYALSGEYLDVDLVKFIKDRNHSKTDIDKLKAIEYRFYKQVHLVNGNYESLAKDGAAIHIAQSDYTVFADKLKSLNAVAKIDKAKGKKFTGSPLDEKYLDALLK
jgi:hypothetical protein